MDAGACFHYRALRPPGRQCSGSMFTASGDGTSKVSGAGVAHRYIRLWHRSGAAVSSLHAGWFAWMWPFGWSCAHGSHHVHVSRVSSCAINGYALTRVRTEPYVCVRDRRYPYATVHCTSARARQLVLRHACARFRRVIDSRLTASREGRVAAGSVRRTGPCDRCG